MIRKAADRDLERIMQIEEICFSSRWTKEMFLYELHENEFGHFYVLEENQKIAGFIDFWITFECCQLANTGLIYKQKDCCSCATVFFIFKLLI